MSFRTKGLESEDLGIGGAASWKEVQAAAAQSVTRARYQPHAIASGTHRGPGE